MCILSTGITLVMCIAVSARAESKKSDMTCQSENIQNITDSEGETTTSQDLFGRCYSPWTEWSKCNHFCQQVRKRKCKSPAMCGTSRLKEKRKCKRKKGNCLVVSYKIHGATEKNNKVVDVLYDLFYHSWTAWKPCNKRCIRKRRRLCKTTICKGGYLEEERKCVSSDGVCAKSLIISKGKNKKSKHKIALTGSVSTNSTCGIRPHTSTRSLRIVGGREAIPHSWPWQAEILVKRKKHFCGGTLIHPKWILTAAHCIPKKHKHKVRVRLAKHNIKKQEDTEIESRVKEFHPYPKFDWDTVLHDIALIKLDKEIPMTNITSTACLPEKGMTLKAGTLCTTVGWGVKAVSSIKFSDALQEVKVPIVRKKKCKKAFTFITINKSQICAGYKKGRKDACVGDSGGPLLCPFVTKDGYTRWHVSGVTSYGEGCGQKGKYGLYTNVAKYLKWIKKTISL